MYVSFFRRYCRQPYPFCCCLQQGLQSQLEEILNAVAVIDGASVHEDEQLFEQVKSVGSLNIFITYAMRHLPF